MPRQIMIAAFLRTEDGDFDYGPAFGAVMFVAMTALFVWILYGALTRGRIPFGFSGRHVQSRTYWFEREKNPGLYWFAFVAYSLMVPFCLWTAYALCTGFFHKPS
jgi:hypothetical protein